MESSASSDIDQFLAKLKLTKDNHQFLALIHSEFTFLMRLNTLLKEQQTLQQITDAIREYA